MGITRVSLVQLSKEPTIRTDMNYIKSITDYDSADYDYRKLFEIVVPEKVNLSELDDFEYAEIGNVTKGGDVNPIKLSFTDRAEENDSLFKKIENGDIMLPREGDILLSKIRPYLNKNVLIEDQHTYFTKAFIQIRPKINSVLFYNLIRAVFYEKINSVSRCGKGYPTLNEDDLKSIRFPKNIIDSVLKKSEYLLNEIKTIELDISALKGKRVSDIEIVNEVLGEEFGFDREEFDKRKKQKQFLSSLQNFSRSIDCRMGCRFLCPSSIYMLNFMNGITNKRIKDFVSEPICLGTSISPNNYDDDGEYKYIAMSSFPNWELNLDDSKNVNDDYSKQKQEKTVRKNDIILARSGEGTIGKVALVKADEIKAIFADFTQRIRLKNYNVDFAYYYFRSVFFQYLIYKEKKGLGNNTNIFPNQIQMFPLPDFTSERQSEIVSKIEQRISAQKEIDDKIESKRQEISKLIEDVIVRQ